MRAERRSISGPGPCVRQIPGTELVTENDSGFAWPSWREALMDAHEGIARAEERRRQVFQAAWDAGLSLRQIAEVVGISAAGIHRIIGKQRGPSRDDSLLDAPAFSPAAQPGEGDSE